MLSYFFLLFLFLTSATSDELAALRRLSSSVGGRTLQWNFSSSTPCNFSGIVCNSAGNVSQLNLPGFGLSGKIPAATFGNLSALTRLSLRQNYLSGPLPSDLPSGLESLFLQSNNFSGEIPDSLFSCYNLQRLVLSNNHISGEISSELNKLGKLRILDLDNNDLSGSIPELDSLTNLRTFNVSYNKFTGEIPRILRKFNTDSFINTSLCGSPMSPCESSGKNGSNLSTGAIVGIVIGSIVGLIIILVILFLLWRRYVKSESSSRTQPRADTSPATPVIINPELVVVERKFSKSSENGVEAETIYCEDGMVFFDQGCTRFRLEDLLRASAEVLGKGKLGSSYRAYLESATEVVVKRLRNVCVGEGEFKERIEVFGKLSHENLVGMMGYYLGKEEKLVVYECLPFGSLANLLHGYRRADLTPLTWEERLRIAYEAARGICYLHSKGPTFSHGNIKSSNILLTDSYSARVSEFCINQLVSNTSSLGLNNYCAPEVTDTRSISQKSDVYSFGVVLLELVTGKAPVEDDMNLPKWVQERGESVLDVELVRFENDKTRYMAKFLQLGIECTSVRPDKRPKMSDVANNLEELCRSR